MFFFTQIVACVVVVIVVFSEVRHFVVSWMMARFLNADLKQAVVNTLLAGFPYIVVPVFTLNGSMFYPGIWQGAGCHEGCNGAPLLDRDQKLLPDCDD
jgi:hypothetical protein